MGLTALGAFVFLIGGSSLVLTAITLVAVEQTLSILVAVWDAELAD